ncbi:hypothetical protein [Acrocarpospora catenulata]|uniref:hypothetical protein n=1 Tax=Acrocarpospora catenulata TaxID=2836182 RepID=UPI001BDA9D84|nr:hypothetical protein [Acrocarpospora catenulata]
MSNEINCDSAPVPDDLFYEDASVLVWFPLTDDVARDRGAWSWLPGSIIGRCGPDEWHVLVEVPALAVPGPSVPTGDAPENLLYPVCFRDASELRPLTETEWEQACRRW